MYCIMCFSYCMNLFIFRYSTWHFGVFKKLGVKGPQPIPVFGTMFPFMCKVNFYL